MNLSERLTIGNTTLLIYNGTVSSNGKDFNIIVLDYKSINNEYNVSIDDVIFNVSKNSYEQVVVANTIPNGTKIYLGDIFYLNISSPWAIQMITLASSLTQVGLNYLLSSNQTINKLGEDYINIVNSIFEMIIMTPMSVQTLNINSSYSAVFDSNATLCALSIAMTAIEGVASAENPVIFVTVYMEIILPWDMAEIGLNCLYNQGG